MKRGVPKRHRRAEALFEQVNRAIDTQDFLRAEELARDGLALLDEANEEDGDLLAWGWLLLAIAIGSDIRRAQEALQFLDRVQRLDPEDEDARELRDALVRDYEKYAETLRTYRLDSHPRVHLDAEEVRRHLESILGSLPDEIHASLENVMIEVVEMPDPRIDGELASSSLLGFYQGLTLAHGAERFFPDRIRIFKRNVERFASNREEALEQLRITLLHEIGHHLGLDEDDLHDLGLG